MGLDLSLIERWGDVGNSLYSFCHVDPADPACWQPPLHLSLGAVSPKTELWQSNGRSEGNKRTWGLVCLQERWGKSLRQGVVFKGLKRHFADYKEEAVTFLPLGKSDDRKGCWQQGSEVGRGERKTWTAGKGSQKQECSRQAVRESIYHIII